MHSPLEDDADVPTTTDDRCAGIELADGGVVIYDREQPTAWVQSDRTVEVPSTE